MKTLTTQLLNDEAGFIVSGELVLVSTIVVLAMLVGLSEVSHNINQELEDVGSAFGAINQSYEYRLAHGHKGCATGSFFHDEKDNGDGQCDVNCNSQPMAECQGKY